MASKKIANLESSYRQAEATYAKAKADTVAQEQKRFTDLRYAPAPGSFATALDPAGKELEIAHCEAELARNEAADRYNCAAPDLEELRQLLIAELKAAGEAFNKLPVEPSRPTMLASYSAEEVAKHINAVAAYAAEVEHASASRKVGLIRLRGAYTFVGAAVERLRIARQQANLPGPKQVIPFLKGMQPLAVTPSTASLCTGAIAAIEAQRDYVERDDVYLKRTSMEKLREKLTKFYERQGEDDQAGSHISAKDVFDPTNAGAVLAHQKKLYPNLVWPKHKGTEAVVAPEEKLYPTFLPPRETIVG